VAIAQTYSYGYTNFGPFTLIFVCGGTSNYSKTNSHASDDWMV